MLANRICRPTRPGRADQADQANRYFERQRTGAKVLLIAKDLDRPGNYFLSFMPGDALISVGAGRVLSLVADLEAESWQFMGELEAVEIWQKREYRPAWLLSDQADQVPGAGSRHLIEGVS